MVNLSFLIHLDNYEIDTSIRPHGLLFHRWLPDGREDAISIPVRDERNSLQIWFDRKGYIDKNFIKFDAHRSEVNDTTMARQGKLESNKWGQVYG